MAGKYTAIVYFHGIGTQRRYEEISRLIDSLDQYAGTTDPLTVGNLRAQQVELEHSRITDKPDGSNYVSYIRFNRLLEPLPNSGSNRKRFAGAFRLYEGYWSSLLAAGLSPERVLLWTLARAPMPIMSLIAPWRAHMRLKLSYLFRMQARDPEGATSNRTAYEQIADAYYRFENWEARRQHREGTFKQFLKHLRTDDAAKRKDRSILTDIAGHWRYNFAASQWLIFWKIVTLLAGVIGLVTFAVYAIAPLLDLIGFPFAKQIVDLLPQQPSLLLTVAAAPFALGAYYLGRSFLKNYLSDVVFWTAREGKSELYKTRDAVLDHAVDILRHVLLDDKCRRVVVIGHSLGSSIGYRALLELGKRRQSLGKLEDGTPDPYPYGKISHFITLGSPIEMIHYFFELLNSRHHRYNRIANELLGSAESRPFKVGRDRAIKWVNFYSDADPISGQIYSQGMLRMPAIENVEVIGGYAPSPGDAHSSYFHATQSIARLFDMAILNDRDETSPPPIPKYAAILAHVAVGGFHFSLVVAAWALFAAAIGYWFSVDALRSSGLFVAFVVGAVMTLFWGGLKLTAKFVPLDIDGQLRKRAEEEKEKEAKRARTAKKQDS